MERFELAEPVFNGRSGEATGHLGLQRTGSLVGCDAWFLVIRISSKITTSKEIFLKFSRPQRKGRRR